MTDSRNKIENEIDNFLGDNFKTKKEIKNFIKENCIENDSINFKSKKNGKSIIGFAIEIGEIDLVNYLLGRSGIENKIEITQNDFDLAVNNGYYYIAKKLSEKNLNIDTKNINFKEYKFNYGKDYFNEKKTELEEKIKIFLQSKDLDKLKSNLCTFIFSENKILNNLSEDTKNNLVSKLTENKESNSDIIHVIKELLLNCDYEAINNILKIDDNNAIKNITDELKNIIKSNDNNIEKLINDYIVENLNNIETAQSDMANVFKSDFNSYINRNETEENLFYSRYLQYLNKSNTNENILDSNQELSQEEILSIKEMLSDNLDLKTPIGLNQNLLSKDNCSGHYILCFNDGNKFDDSIGSGVQIDNCCGIYFAHMYYIAEIIYDKMSKSKSKFDYNIFKKLYDKYRLIYVENARQNNNLDIMRKINCKNRLCIAAKISLERLDGYISKEVYNKLMNKIKEAIKNSFITEKMNNEFNNLDNNIKIEIEKAEKEKLEFTKKYIESFKITKNNSKDINNNIEKIRKGYYERKLKKIDNIKKVINTTDNNKGEINKLIINGEISNRKIIESILSENDNNNSKKIIDDKNFSKAVLPDIEVNGKVYSGFNGEANYNEDDKIFTIKYNQDGFFDDKLNLMNNLNEDLKKNLKQGLKIKLKESQNDEKLLEIFALLKTNPVLALLELNDISEKIYLGDEEIKNNEKIFNELINIFGVISESRRQIIKLNNIIKTKEKKYTEKIETLTDEVIYAEIETYMSKFLKEALMDNEKAEKIINLTDFKDINIIIDQSLELFKTMENKEELKNIFNSAEQSDVLKTLSDVFKRENEKEDIKLTAFMNCFNILINSKLKKTKEKIENISRQEELNTQSR